MTERQSAKMRREALEKRERGVKTSRSRAIETAKTNHQDVWEAFRTEEARLHFYQRELMRLRNRLLIRRFLLFFLPKWFFLELEKEIRATEGQVEVVKRNCDQLLRVHRRIKYGDYERELKQQHENIFWVEFNAAQKVEKIEVEGSIKIAQALSFHRKYDSTNSQREDE